MKNENKISKEEVTKILRESSRKLLDKEHLEKEEQPKTPGFFEKVKSFSKSMISRGINNKKCSEETKSLRFLSCHGKSEIGLAPCEHRKGSVKFQGSFFCGGCGCGDKRTTQLVNITQDGSESYSKLDYPTVNCPLNMPGFTNYSSSEHKRKKMIESELGIEYIKQNSK